MLPLTKARFVDIARVSRFWRHSIQRVDRRTVGSTLTRVGPHVGGHEAAQSAPARLAAALVVAVPAALQVDDPALAAVRLADEVAGRRAVVAHGVLVAQQHLLRRRRLARVALGQRLFFFPKRKIPSISILRSRSALTKAGLASRWRLVST